MLEPRVQEPAGNLKQVRERALQQVADNPEQLLADYTRRFGNVLNADDASELFPDYCASRDSRTRFRTAVHPAAQWVRDELFQRALADPAVKAVVFTAGGTGAGKSTGRPDLGDVVLDSTFSNPEHSQGLVESTLGIGKQVHIIYTYRPIEEAMHAALDRSMEQGRVVPIDLMIQTHDGSAKTVEALYGHYRDNPNVDFQFIDNSSGDSKPGTIDLTARQDYRGERDNLHAILESRRSELPEIIYLTAKGPWPGGARPTATGASPPQPQGSIGTGQTCESRSTAAATTTHEQVTTPTQVAPTQTPADQIPGTKRMLLSPSSPVSVEALHEALPQIAKPELD